MSKKIHLIGNAHLDPVWFWRWQEGLMEVKATFRSALDRMNEFPDYKFTSACSFYYMWIEKSDKTMFDEIVERVKEGRWNIVGGWGIQPDCNIPSGESFARHSLISQRYFKEKFGVTAKTGYNVDSFGHNAAIPKILKGSGMDNYVFMRPMPHEKNIPEDLFDWESMDGSKVRTYRLPMFYNIDSTRFECFEKVKEMDTAYEQMAFFGVGNHGGGPTIELLDRMQKELGEEFVYSTPDEYFECNKDAEVITVNDDLQFHAKGCYSVCSQVKVGNRKSENGLINAEKYSVLSNKLIGTEYPSDELDRAWNNVLFNQFHDILGGCCAKEAYEDAQNAYSEAISIAERNRNFALQQISWNIDTMDGKKLKPYKPAGPPVAEWVSEERIGSPVVVFNPLAFSIKACINVKSLPKYVTDDNGNVIPMQIVRASKTDCEKKWEIAFEAEIPALGYSTYRMYFESEKTHEYENPFKCCDNSIENEYIKLVFNPTSGELINMLDKKTGTELLKEATKTVLVDEEHCDTWAHDIAEFRDVVATACKGSVKLMEAGPVRARIRSVVEIGNSTIRRDYILSADSEIVEVKTKIDFHEQHKMLKFYIPTAATNPKAYGKIPYGFIERTTDGKEHACGEWALVKGENCGIGAANDSKYSFSVMDSTLELTVLRGAMYADHFGQRDEWCEYMEQGIHEFEYSIFPYKSISDTEKKAQLLNNKPTNIVETFHKGTLKTGYSGIEVSKDNIVVTAIKKSVDNDGIILRCYETEDVDTEVEIRVFDTTFNTAFKHSQVKTFAINNGEVKEVNLVEW